MRPRTSNRTFQICQIACCLAVILPGAALSAEEKICDYAISTDLNHTLRTSSIAPGQSDLFALEIPAAGILAFDIVLPGSHQNEPVVEFLDQNCSPADTHVIERLVLSQVLAVENPGAYFLRVTAPDFSQILGGYRLITRFVDRIQPEVDLELITTKDEDEDEIDEWIDEVISMTYRGDFDPEGCWVDARRFAPEGSDPGSTSVKTRAWCDRADGDDHADSILCATPVGPGQQVEGELQNPWGDDADYFTLALDKMTVVRIASRSTVNTFVALYDRFGNRLTAVDSGGSGASFHFVKTLGRGRYFVRVEGVGGSEGSYRLQVD